MEAVRSPRSASDRLLNELSDSIGRRYTLVS